MAFWDQVAKAVTVFTDWAIRREDRRATLDAVLAELESNRVSLEGLTETVDGQWQKSAASRWLTPELRRVLQRTYRLLGDYNHKLDRVHNPPPPTPGVHYVGFPGFYAREVLDKARDAAKPHVSYAASCVSAYAAGKVLPPPPPEVH